MSPATVRPLPRRGQRGCFVDGCTRPATTERLIAAEHDATIERLVPLCAEHAAELDAEDTAERGEE